VENDQLSPVAKKLIAGFLQLAPSLTAFGNTVPTSFLRLVPHQEAPTSICWGDRNRSVLVRVPLGWLGVSDMVKIANPNEPDNNHSVNNQTVELRNPDGSANIHLLLAGMTIAAIKGLEHPDSLKIAEKLYITEEASARKNLDQLPSSCSEAADCLDRDRHFYEKDGIFPTRILDGVIKELKNYKDKDLSEKLFGNADALKDLVQEFLHCG
ncbi:MAG: glutamine synthetase, partial [Candidatus Aminicenantes bacterium]|nr:glutamine synthetase [Candidatus Aminicenantes bacterium]